MGGSIIGVESMNAFLLTGGDIIRSVLIIGCGGWTTKSLLINSVLGWAKISLSTIGRGGGTMISGMISLEGVMIGWDKRTFSCLEATIGCEVNFLCCIGNDSL